MEKAYGEKPLIGYTVTLAELKIDYEVYKMLHQATGGGSSMTPDQMARLKQLQDAFEQ